VPESTNSDSGKLLQSVVELATGEIQEIAAHVKTIDTCLRGDIEGGNPGLIHRMTTIEANCKRNHRQEGEREQLVQEQINTNRMEVPRATVVWTVDKIIMAIATGIALLISSFGALTSTCNSREIRKDNRRWRQPGAPYVAPPTDSN
jgi:hypothetical protein